VDRCVNTTLLKTGADADSKFPVIDASICVDTINGCETP